MNVTASAIWGLCVRTEGKACWMDSSVFVVLQGEGAYVLTVAGAGAMGAVSYVAISVSVSVAMTGIYSLRWYGCG
jgi:hypothetical protein